MKKALTTFIFLLSLLVTPHTSFATNDTESATDEYATIDAPYLNLTANQSEDGSIYLNWQAEELSNLNKFLYWKLIRSNTNSTPIYPDDGYIFYDTEKAADSYVDIGATQGTNYYRVCAITTNFQRYCSSVITLKVTKTEDITYQDIVLDPNLNFSATINSLGKVELSWEARSYEKFVYWKLIRSKDNSNPTYPEDGYIFYSNYADTSSYIDSDPLSIPAYYRLCAITSDHARYCSSVLEVDTTTETVSTSESTPSITTTCTNDDGPVCGTDGQTYSSSCAAEENSVEVDYTSECKTTEDTTGFTDITNHRYHNAIQYVQTQGIVEGYSDETYRPDNTINRAEFAKILYQARFTASSSDTGNCFSDVTQSLWFAPAICRLQSEGVVQGYPDGSFGIAQNINIVEALKIILLTYDINIPATDGAWYTPYWEYALENNLLPPTITSIDQEITRAEMAEIIYLLNN